MTTEPKHGLKRYRLSHNRDFIPIMTEALESQFIRIPEQEWVKASEVDALIAAKDAEIAGLRLDAELGRVAMQFVDRAGDVCKEDPAERICDEFNIAMAATVELHRRAARSKQEKRDE